jgi:NTE family protein
MFSGLTCNGQAITNLVLEGAGVRGIAYVGALKYLEEKNLSSGIEKVGGTSAGAIMALTISLGYNSKEIEDLVYSMKVQKFNDGKFFFIGGIARMNRHYGWYRGKRFSNWLEEVIENKTGNADITFAELYAKGFKDLYVTGTSLNNQKLIVFSRASYPNMKVKDAVRISMSIPLYFEALIIDSAGHVVSRRDAKRYHDIVVDGGLTGNFPITIFDSASINHRVINTSTLGLRIDTPEQIAYDTASKGIAPIPIHRFKTYVGAFYNFVIENLNRSQLTAADWKRSVSISCGDIGPKIRKLKIEEKNLLINNGYEAMRSYNEKKLSVNAIE